MIDVQPLLRARSALRDSEEAELHGNIPEALKQSAIASLRMKEWSEQLMKELAEVI